MEKTKKIKIFIGIFYLTVLFSFLYFLFSTFTFDEITSYKFIQLNRDYFEEAKESNIIFLTLIFSAFTILWVFLLGFGSPVALLGGFIFGKWFGTLIVAISLSIGSLLLYIFGSYFLKDYIKNKFLNKFQNLENKFRNKEFIFFLIYRFVGGIPFFISNILPTIFNVKVRNFFFGSLIGMLPQIFIGVSLGAGLNKVLEENSNLPNFLELIFTPDIYLPIFGLIILLVFGLILRKKFISD